METRLMRSLMEVTCSLNGANFDEFERNLVINFRVKLKINYIKCGPEIYGDILLIEADHNSNA